MSGKIAFYVINYKNDERRNRMKKRFDHFGIDPCFPEGVETTDTRLMNTPTGMDKRIWAIMLQHLDAIRHFYEQSDLPYCVVCEDDIHISRNYLTDLTQIVPKFEQLQLDMLLMGCLLPYKIDMNTCLHQQYYVIIDHSDKFVYHRFPNDLWGCQMYMISRKYAKYLLDTFNVQYAIENIDKPYNPDWIITKNGNRAMIYPMLAVEEGVNVSNCQFQIDYHMQCYLLNYTEKDYI